MKIKSQKLKVKSRMINLKVLAKIFAFYFLLFNFIGCDAFVRKFTRKPKKENLVKEEMVLEPQDYKGPQPSREDLYRQYFLFWKSWHDELINSLLQKASQKKQIDCSQEAIKNLESIKPFLNEQAQKRLDLYIVQLKELKALIAKDTYAGSASANARKAEHLKRDILRDFSYNKIKNYLI